MLCCNDSDDDEIDDSYDDGSIFKGLSLLQSKVKNKTLTLENKQYQWYNERSKTWGKNSKLKTKESTKGKSKLSVAVA